ncbi:hypothetical protein PGTUg99_018995 [Puccinia graminis f. sp. tritici]|uniref:CxC1-like cysteine cluster associated with KDZ transposases domain-containing protein n=1 Tax=Puccinia graminis f. sp. tritici TaxID=56615 RepID=A0A5B0QQV9_PUCGR|nr:hypothetical protein PGTUg99_018995 [Puccinia graminis f. sp. tritici]
MAPSKKKIHVPINGNRTDKLRRAANSGLYTEMLSRLRAGQRAATRGEAERSEQAAFQQEDILQQPYDDMNIDIPPNEDQEQADSAEVDADTQAEWVTLAPDITNPIDEVIQSRIEQHRREARNFNMASVMRALHPTYIALKLRTENWAGAEAAKSFVNCRCLPHTLTKRTVDMVDIVGQHRRKMAFCGCTHDAVRLLQQGYLAGSPMQPQTAFSMRLMIFHNDLWNHCHVGTLPFTSALRQWLEPRSERLFAKNSRHARDLRKPFTAAVDMFRKLNDMTDSLVMQALKLTEQEKLAGLSCPACFGPQPPNPDQYPESTRDRLIICLDGNFQHRHHLKASRDETIQSPRIFLEQREVEDMSAHIRAKELENKPPASADRCADAHKAADDKRNESTWKGCDDTGLMGCCCRHDAAVYLANIHKSGEQRNLPCALINRVLGVVEPTRKLGILYDIGCSLDKFIRLRGLFQSDRTRFQFATSIFHAYVHNWLCQLDYNPRYNKGWGLSDGEGLERMWSYLSPLVSPLRYATRNHRLAAIAHRLKFHNHRGITRLAFWLRRKFGNAVTRRREARAELAGLLDTKNPHSEQGVNYTKGFFMRQWKNQCQFQKDHTEDEHDRRTKLVKLYKEEGVLELLRNRLMGPEVFLATEDQVEELLNNISEKTKELKKLAEELHITNSTSQDRNEEERLLLLLWDAKSELFIHAVNRHAELQPVVNSKTMGTRLGTKLKEKIFKAIGNRRPAVNRSIAQFNKCHSDFVARFPDQSVSGFQGQLTYDLFSELPLDDKFWNDGLYFHSKAPWAVDPDVRAGITCVLVLSRIQEEFQLIAQELARVVGWAIAHHAHLVEFIVYLQRHRKDENGHRISGAEEERLVPLDHIDEMYLGGISRRQKFKMIERELRTRLDEHEALVEDWSEDVIWLWSMCQPIPNKPYIKQWHELISRIRTRKTRSETGGGIDETLEDTVIEVGALDGDGEDASDEWINEAQ